jgi:hypothetical protein
MASKTIKRKVLARHDKYMSVFRDNQSGPAVLADLKRFCFYDKEIYDTDATKMAFLAGRRSVFLRILGLLDLTPEQVTKLKEESL